MKVTAEILRQAFCQAQREILDPGGSGQTKSDRFQMRWERMAELLNEKIAIEQEKAEIEISIKCQNCQFVHHQGDHYAYFFQSFREFDVVPCPHCRRINWVLIARIASEIDAPVEGNEKREN